MNCEFHLTVGDSELVRYLNAKNNCFRQGTNTLAIENLNEHGYPVSSVWMTAEKASLRWDHSAALRYLADCQNTKGWHNHTVYEPVRSKIEVEYSPECILREYLYVETHYTVTSREAESIPRDDRSKSNIRRLSRNLYTGKLIATERCYSQSLFRDFIETHSKLNRKVELCLLDTNVQHDAEGGWMKVPKDIGIMSEVTRENLSNLWGTVSRSTKIWDVY